MAFSSAGGREGGREGGEKGSRTIAHISSRGLAVNRLEGGGSRGEGSGVSVGGHPISGVITVHSGRL